MHGNSPHVGSADVDVTPERRRALRRELVDVATRTRDILADEFVVGGEISEGDGALQATVAVQPPAGSVVSAGFDSGATDDPNVESLAQDLAAGAVVEAKHAARDVEPTAR